MTNPKDEISEILEQSQKIKLQAALMIAEIRALELMYEAERIANGHSN